jgi:hypothetical protein
MSDAPEYVVLPGVTVTGWAAIGEWNVSTHALGGTVYRRADLPPTPEQIMADPRVKALVDALDRIAHASDVYGVEANAEDQGADTLAYAHKSTCNLARAALAAIKETK